MHSPRRNPQNTRPSPRPRARRRKRSGRQRRLETARTRAANGGLILTAAGLAAAHLCLVRVGPPPAIRIDALWVLDHQAFVERGLWALAAAGLGSAVPMLLGRRRLAVLVLWGLAAAVAVKFFSDRLPIIASVVLDRAV